MGGRVLVKSVYGTGSVFEVHIPQIIKGDATIGNFMERHKEFISFNSSVKKFKAPKAKLLVVDDVAMNLKVVSGLLKETEIKIDTATNGEDALKLVEKNHYDLILLDHMMPVMDGIETFQCMKDIPGFDIQTTPVVMLTANAIVGAKDAYIKAGFTDYITKPIREEVLLSIVKRLLPPELITEAIVAEKGDSKEKSNSMGELSDMLDTATGLGYCMNDKSFYREMLVEYIKNDHSADLENFFAKNDFENYRIVIHSLKSTSLTIGAVKLSETAKALETACKEGNIDFIKTQHNDCITAYKMLLEKLSQYLASGDS